MLLVSVGRRSNAEEDLKKEEGHSGQRPQQGLAHGRAFWPHRNNEVPPQDAAKGKPAMNRVFNFSAGPAALPEPVLQQAAAEML
ncbi:MAG TPA: hypothetical protein VEZ89_18230, partial [Rubrivivax sp.]|nr:hypothetical protein [Rubrivivax sp.]